MRKDIAYYCDECEGHILIGEDCYIIGDRHYCQECVRKVEAEASEPFDESDRKYDEWRDRKLMEEWENADRD